MNSFNLFISFQILKQKKNKKKHKTTIQNTMRKHFKYITSNKTNKKKKNKKITQKKENDFQLKA